VRLEASTRLCSGAVRVWLVVSSDERDTQGVDVMCMHDPGDLTTERCCAQAAAGPGMAAAAATARLCCCGLCISVHRWCCSWCLQIFALPRMKAAPTDDSSQNACALPAGRCEPSACGSCSRRGWRGVLDTPLCWKMYIVSTNRLCARVVMQQGPCCSLLLTAMVTVQLVQLQ
jgi:hypothetical protein